MAGLDCQDCSLLIFASSHLLYRPGSCSPSAAQMDLSPLPAEAPAARVESGTPSPGGQHGTSSHDAEPTPVRVSSGSMLPRVCKALLPVLHHARYMNAVPLCSIAGQCHNNTEAGKKEGRNCADESSTACVAREGFRRWSMPDWGISLNGEVWPPC